MWREEIYERAPDFKAKVATARFRSSEWRFLAALDGRRSAGDIARDLGIDDAVAAKFLDAQEAVGAIVPSLLSFEEFERVAGPLDDGALERDFPEAALAALRETTNRNGKATLDGEPQRDATPASPPPAAQLVAPAPPPVSATAPAPAPAAAPGSAGTAKIDASVGAAFETLRKLREREPALERAPALEPSPAPTPAPTPVSATAATPPPALETPTPRDAAPVEPRASRAELPTVLDAAQTSIVEALVAEAPQAERAIVHESGTVIPLASMVERVGKSASERVDAETAAWNAVLERMRGDVPRERSNDAPASPSDDVPPATPPNVRRLPFGKRPPV